MDASQYIQLAKSLIQTSDYRRAIEYLQQAVVEDGTNKDAHLLLSDCYVQIGDTAKAQAELYKVLAIDPQNQTATAKLKALLIGSPTSSNSQSLANYSHTSSTSSSSYSTQSPVKHVNNTPPTSGFVVEKSRRGDFYTFSATFPDGNILYFKCWYSEDETLQVCEPTDNDGWTGYRKPCGHVDIPSYLEYAGTKYKVTEIGPCAFENCNSITSVNIPATIYTISVRAFKKCTSLSEVVVPDSVHELSSYVFEGCTFLRKAIISKNVTHFYDGVFEGCTNLSSLTIGMGMKREFTRLNRIPSNGVFVLTEEGYGSNSGSNSNGSIANTVSDTGCGWQIAMCAGAFLLMILLGYMLVK